MLVLFLTLNPREMKRTTMIRVHLVTTLVAGLTISSFFSFSLIAEISRDTLFIKQVKTGILYSLPLLVIAMPTLALSGKKLAGNSTNPLIVQKMNRMKIIALNGMLLVSLAIYLYYHTRYQAIDRTFLYVQLVELLLGATNLSLIFMNTKAGLQLSGRWRKSSNTT